MAAYIRSYNPVWSLVDLAGKQFDDTFYMWVLTNDLPYLPLPVYHTTAGIPWTNPIRFLANGTLPPDIFWDDSLVYRLEFRKNDGVLPPSQNDPLIYLIENYEPGTGGVTPPDSAIIATDNQITNPQFARMMVDSPFTLTGVTNPDPIQIAPGWELELTGTGNVTIERVSLNSSQANPSNAPYALRIALSGDWTDTPLLRQRFEQNGMLWANKTVSCALTARIEGSPQAISGILIDSNNTPLAQVLPSTPLNSEYNEYSGYGQLGASSNPDLPPVAYIDFCLQLPTDIDLYVTSFQLIASDVPLEVPFEQDSINRQLDYTYHADYPIVPIGAVVDFCGFFVPEHYFECNGQAVSRTRYAGLFDTLTTVETVTLTSGVNTFTVASSAPYYIGMAIEGDNIPAATTISNIVGTTITMSANATASGASDVRFFAAGAGDGSTTFNVPDLRDYVVAGAGGSLGSGIGVKVGAATHTLTIQEMPAHDHPGSLVAVGLGVNSTTGPGAFSNPTAGPTGVTVASQGGGLPHSIVQQTALLKKCIRFE